MEDKEEAVVRRSSRQRKLLYGTFDPKILERALYVDKQSYEHDEENPRKKRRVEEANDSVREFIIYKKSWILFESMINWIGSERRYSLDCLNDSLY